MIFTNKQINQIAELIEIHFTAFNRVKVDRRKFDKQVIQFALQRGLVRQADGSRAWHYTGQPVFVAQNSSDYDFMLDTPVETLWVMFRRHVMTDTDHIGHSIAARAGWLRLNITPSSSRHYTEFFMEEQLTVLRKLSLHGYIYFQYCVDVWDIWVAEKYRAGTAIA